MLANASLGSSSRQRCQSTWRSCSSPRKQPGRMCGPLHGSTRPSGISFARWMSVRALGASTPRIQSFPGGLVPQPASLQRHLSCVPGSCSSDYTGSEQQFGAISLLSESNAAVRMLQKLFSLSLPLFFLFSPPTVGEEDTRQQWLGFSRYPGQPGPMPHTPCPTHSIQPPDGFVSSGRGEVKGRWFYQINSDW